MKNLLLNLSLILASPIWVQPLIASFNLSNFQGCIGETVSLNSKSTAESENTMKYFWIMEGSWLNLKLIKKTATTCSSLNHEPANNLIKQ